MGDRLGMLHKGGCEVRDGGQRLAPLVVMAAMVLACQASPSVVRQEVEDYLAHTRRWAPVEAEAARAVDRILRTEFVDEAEVRHQIAESRPRVLAHIRRVRAYAPRAEAVARTHAVYVAAWEKLMAAYEAIEEGFATGDHSRLAVARESMAGWRSDIVRVADELRALMARHGVARQEPGAAKSPRQGAPTAGSIPPRNSWGLGSSRTCFPGPG